MQKFLKLRVNIVLKTFLLSDFNLVLKSFIYAFKINIYFIASLIDISNEPRRVTRSRVQDKSNIPISLFCSMINTSVQNKENLDKIFNVTSTKKQKISMETTANNKTVIRRTGKEQKPSEIETTVVQQDIHHNNTEAANKTTSNATLNKSKACFHY